MLRSTELSHSSDEELSLDCLKADPVELLIVNNVPTTYEAFQFISTDQFRSEFENLQTLIGINLKIKEKIKKNFIKKIKTQEFGIRKSVLIAFESAVEKHESKFYLKLEGNEKFYTLDISDDEGGVVTEYCRDFIIQEMKNGRSGIIGTFKTKDKIDINWIGNEETMSNLLILSTSESRIEIVKNLLNYGFDVDHEDRDEWLAIDYAWESYRSAEEDEVRHKSNEIILCLLGANSTFPINEFEFEEASVEVQEFIDMCEKFHELVEIEDSEALEKSLKEKLTENLKLCIFYDRTNRSLTVHALVKRNLEIISLLLSLNIHSGCSESPEEDTIAQLKNPFADQDILHARKFSANHLHFLRSKSRIANTNFRIDERWSFIEEALIVLDDNETCSKILKVVAAWKKLKIYFDFKYDTTYYFDPTSSIYTEAYANSSGLIVIGAKYLIDDGKKYEVMGILIHEFSHLAMLITYMNNFEPYPMGESMERRRYEGQVMTECLENNKKEDLIKLVYIYPKTEQNCETIVRVPHMLMKYYVRDTAVECENSNKITEMRDVYFPNLFNYHKEVVEPEMESAVAVLKKLQNNGVEINFKDLTIPMRAKILHAKKIIFKGHQKFNSVKTSFLKLIGDDPDIFELLTPVDIRDFLVNQNKFVTVGEMCDIGPKHETIERNFIEFEFNIRGFDVEGEKFNRKIRNFLQIKDEVERMQIFLLADGPGSGKTTTFHHFARKLKESFKNHWVSYIKLGSHMELFEKFHNLHKKLGIHEIFQLLQEILNLKSKIQFEIFKKLFFVGKAVLLFDDFNEISPKYNEFFINIFYTFNTRTQNQLWISTTPQYAKQLMEKFHINVYKFMPYIQGGKVKDIRSLDDDFKNDVLDII